MQLFSKKEKHHESLSALSASLLELSKYSAIHYEVAAKQLSETRLAILQLEGFDVEKFLDLSRRFRQISELEAYIDDLENKKAELEIQIGRSEAKLEAISKKASELGATESDDNLPCGN